jgi:exodeoxyribonuclease III
MKLNVFAWNVNGLRALLSKRPARLCELWKQYQIDILGLMEIKTGDSAEIIKTAEDQLKECIGDDVSIIWNPGTIKGYAGTAAIVKTSLMEKLESMDFGTDLEGRRITLKFKNIAVVILYVPNSGQHLKRLPLRLKEWDPKLSEHCISIGRSRKYGVIVAGDFNCAHRDIDIWNLEHPAILKSAGTTLAERSSFQTCYIDKGLIDTFAHAYPTETGCFSYWSVRAKNRPMNRGLRLDYVLTDGKAEVLQTFLLHDFAENGDHCPV